MPRHSLGTGNVRPVPPLDLEEVKFWLHIMEEHALFIKTGLPFDKPDLIEEAAAFEREFKALYVRADKLTSEKKFAELIAESMESLKEFIRYKQLLLGLSLTNKLGSALPPLFFDHVIREAEYFMAILEKLHACKKLAVVKALEADFWLRLMAEHTKFIGSRIDPSERSLLDVVAGYQAEFDNLSMQARDYVSFLAHKPMDLPAFDRFLQDSRVATVRLRDFKQAVHEMIVTNRMLSTIPAAMADHVRREADHFLLVLSMMEKGVIKVEKDVVVFKNKYPSIFDTLVDETIDDELIDPAEFLGSGREPKAGEVIDNEQINHNEEVIDNIELDYTPGSEREQLPISEDTKAKWDGTDSSAEETVSLEGDTKAEVAEEVAVKAKVVAAEQVVLPSKPVTEPKSKQVKYKWGGNWPRQLGKIKK
ncbi:hypothetical protein SOV_51440 [Sporomusa ovata DSM 2662]|uniref:DUF2935 domain-containing protein n=1 Tax=Sporomusa ovata TaxID=2378 RepID=A0A0U1L2G6_9FIRM|nr:DUF2935 domain-containing protein [Sporomusa ovata]EQB27517.1 hypothetical protein SOV_2c04130 [Sporomusa ovata DSM 2662]CQR73363.1 hypothetical protein SpAn4DRAFT_2595 [Sporomusa ovata]